MQAPNPSGLRPVRPYPRARLVIVTAGLIAALGMVTASMLYASYEDALREQQVTLRNVAIVFAAQTTGVAQAIDGATQRTATLYRARGAGVLTPGFLEEHAGPARPYLARMALFDAAGRLAASVAPGDMARSLPALAAPAAVSAGAGAASIAITISNVDRATGHGILNFMRPVFDTGGQYAGAVLAQVDSARLERLYRSVELGPGGSVTLLHRDGTMLIRGPGYPAGIGESFADTPLFREQLPRASRGAFEAASPVDGVLRLYGYDTVEGYPLVIITGMNRDVALDSWYGRMWSALVSWLLLAGALSFLAWRVARDTRRQFRLIDLVSASEARLVKRFDYLASIMNAVGTPIWVLDDERRIVLANEAFARLVGRPLDALPGLEERSVFDGADQDRERRYAAVLDHGASLDAAGAMRDGSGETRTVIQLTSRLTAEDGKAHLVNVLTDITERERAEARLAWLTEFDPITKLPNQLQFWRLLEARIAGSGGQELAVIALVLERLHEIVDLLGHDAGDRALRDIGELLRRASGEQVAVARIRGAEFAFLLDGAAGRQAVERFAMQVHALMAAPLSVDGRDFFLDPVLGIALYPQDGRNADELHRSAQGACTRAGADMDDAIHFFSSGMHTGLGQRLTIEAHLRRALEHGELRLVYQPKVTVQEQAVIGFEALLRWDNPALGAVSPAQFVPIAERSGLIVPIGAWVLEEACRQMGEWSAQLGRPVKVAVNLSPRQLYQKSLLDTIRRCLAQYQVPRGSLELEITETALMSREEEVDVLMHDIRALGVDLAIDDFGTGYSSLAYLKRFPVSRLKVDRAFVRDIDRDEDSAAIALSIVNLARGLKLKVVAEGVETEAQLAVLRGMACDEYQGFLFSRPLERGDVLPLLGR
ncbi:bifunctional diguanylate cyclase/phosphodiesterase [Massilia yuzhufengensis]|uniref:PAS domain S-box-containing protein/diguanylate cyclase (GGDEF) domain-containing protein n=1 Tax=Massilia yuzhufengensis TaxID=1164594 RepID=A0A1I1P034_9BURK|nr:EAL domain-containing protein [Massilia yuzhufengensis]SFD03085.1 PAS domain S-box-containing protein/diguanylate cyclase (GGDEF) domain-containing protein [Massilia yuzhufengensis]